MEKKKRIIILSAIALVALALLVVGVTYAYFQNQYGSASNADVNVTTYTTDILTFATGDDINIEADQTTFGKDKGSVSGATYASALLTANNKTNKAVEHYYLYLNIENNTFTYSVQDNKPELIMTITDKEGNEVKNIEGLTYTEVIDRTNKKISGYDITTKSGLVTIFNNREIIAEPKAEDKWNITITFVNYEADQNANTGKVLSAKLMIQKESLSVANICKNGQSLSSCIVAMNGVDDNLYHHDGTLENGINDNSYRYAGGSAQPAYYSCKYKDIDIPNTLGIINKSLKGDCNSVYKVFTIMPGPYFDKSINKIINDKTTVKWDSTNNKCVTADGENTIQTMTGEALPRPMCEGYAYKLDGEEGWFGGIIIKELGPGEETLFTPEDKENQKPALYSCKYNGIDVENLENGDINSSLKGDCDSVYEMNYIETGKYFDKTFNTTIKNKETVKWDSENNKCVTSSGADITIMDNEILKTETFCVGDAYLIDGKWRVFVEIENLGTGKETLVEPEIKGVNNFVCFGSNADVCPDDNLYRIIGVIDNKVKLIKNDFATSDLLGTDGAFYGSLNIRKQLLQEGIPEDSISEFYKGKLENWYIYFSSTTDWKNNKLNNINLNTNFLKNIGEEWSNKIIETTWKYGGNTKEKIAQTTPSTAYQNEIVNHIPGEHISKIGLMYVSDYAFAASPSAWTTTLNEYDKVKNKNWIDLGWVDWTITANAPDYWFSVQGNVLIKGTEDIASVRPTFSLLPTITYKSGSGTPADPIRIK